MMNQELKTKWVEALRSGKYTQGNGLLCNLNSEINKLEHCCLGVLCEVAGVVRIHDDEGNYKFDGKQDYLSNTLLEKFGIGHQEQKKLACMNDGSEEYSDAGNAVSNEFENKPQTFGQIADWIEKNL